VLIIARYRLVHGFRGLAMRGRHAARIEQGCVDIVTNRGRGGIVCGNPSLSADCWNQNDPASRGREVCPPPLAQPYEPSHIDLAPLMPLPPIERKPEDRSPMVVSIDNPQQNDFISRNYKYTDRNFGLALREAADQHKPIVLVVGGANRAG